MTTIQTSVCIVGGGQRGFYLVCCWPSAAWTSSSWKAMRPSSVSFAAKSSSSRVQRIYLTSWDYWSISGRIPIRP